MTATLSRRIEPLGIAILHPSTVKIVRRAGGPVKGGYRPESPPARAKRILR
jgi:hypothetical protein